MNEPLPARDELRVIPLDYARPRPAVRSKLSAPGPVAMFAIRFCYRAGKVFGWMFQKPAGRRR